MDTVEEALEKVTESSEPAGGMTDGCVEGVSVAGPCSPQYCLSAPTAVD